MSTKALFPCGGGSNLILGIGPENQIFILITPVTIKSFHQILKNCHFSVNKIIPHPYGFVSPIYGPLHYSLGVL